MVEPTKTRIISGDPEARAGSVLRDRGEVASSLSDADVERIAQRVVEILDTRNAAPQSKTIQDDGYIPIKRNREQRPMSEY